SRNAISPPGFSPVEELAVGHAKGGMLLKISLPKGGMLLKNKGGILVKNSPPQRGNPSEKLRPPGSLQRRSLALTESTMPEPGDELAGADAQHGVVDGFAQAAFGALCEAA